MATLGPEDADLGWRTSGRRTFFGADVGGAGDGLGEPGLHTGHPGGVADPDPGHALLPLGRHGDDLGRVFEPLPPAVRGRRGVAAAEPGELGPSRLGECPAGKRGIARRAGRRLQDRGGSGRARRRRRRAAGPGGSAGSAEERRFAAREELPAEHRGLPADRTCRRGRGSRGARRSRRGCGDRPRHRRRRRAVRGGQRRLAEAGAYPLGGRRQGRLALGERAAARLRGRPPGRYDRRTHDPALRPSLEVTVHRGRRRRPSPATD